MDAKKKAKIKPLYSKHLEELLKDKGLKKYQFAEMIPISVQTISEACNGKGMSKHLAERICELFPEYNLSWVLGQDAPKYVSDVEKQKQELKHTLMQQQLDRVVSQYLNIAAVCTDAGYSMTWNLHNVTIKDSRTGYERVLTLDEFDEFREDFAAFLTYRLGKLMVKGR